MPTETPVRFDILCEKRHTRGLTCFDHLWIPMPILLEKALDIRKEHQLIRTPSAILYDKNGYKKDSGVPFPINDKQHEEIGLDIHILKEYMDHIPIYVSIQEGMLPIGKINSWKYIFYESSDPPFKKLTINFNLRNSNQPIGNCTYTNTNQLQEMIVKLIIDKAYLGCNIVNITYEGEDDNMKDIYEVVPRWLTFG